MTEATLISIRERVEDWLLERLQRRCPHDPRYVAADILDGDFHGGPGGDQAVEWCMRCGAYRRVSDPFGQRRYSDLHEPRATWTQWHRAGGAS